MRQSQLFGGTRRETPKGEESKNAILLIRGGYVNKTMAGVYAYLPLGLRTLRKISDIVREEMDALPGVQEVLLPALQPRELWEESGRWQEYVDDVMYTTEHDTIGLGPTHEEIVSDLFRQYYSSYKDLPQAVYQIQTKFRRELRAKSGLLRGREFLMKDMYSFHLTETDLLDFYEKVREAYLRVYTRCGLEAIYTEASGGLFSQYSHEFQVINPAGEDTIYLNAAGNLARNKEIVSSETDPELLQFCGGEVRKAQATEAGNIFPLNHKFSTPMGLTVSSEAGESTEPWMGCYGIGISRLMGVMAELFGDLEKGSLPWPAAVAPFAMHLLDLTSDHQGEKLYADLQKQGADVLYDDRERSAGEKFADADLVGAPVRLIISKRSLEQGGVEVRKGGETTVKTLEELKQTIV